MNFKNKSTFGDHKILSYDTKKHPFIEYFQDLFENNDIENIYLSMEQHEIVEEKDTQLHKKFYNDIKSNDRFKKLYCNLVKDIYSDFFNEEKILIFQSYPSIRIQFFDKIVVPPHCDSDDLGKHPLGEKNFIIPITKMCNTNTIYIESEPGKQDFKNIDMDYGDLFFFNGNKCVHYNMKNQEKTIRISLDFRIILLQDYMKYIHNDITFTNPRDEHRVPNKMVIGDYYQMCFKNEIHNIENWFFQKKLLLQSRPNFGEEEAVSCYKYMSEGDNFITEYTQTEHLEKMICDYTKSKYCIMTTSGTASLIVSLLSLDLKKDDEVIVPNYTMIATINAIINAGGKPVIIDVDENTFTISPHLIKNAITNKTKAVIHVSLNNRICELEKIVDICNERNITLIEDSAQSLGCFYKEKHLGTYGQIGCFSLSTPKIISTGQGGFIVTNNDELYKKMTMIKNFGRKNSGIDDFETFGLNFKFTDLQAVIGIEQMKKLDWRVNRMKEIHNLYYENLKELNIIQKSSYDGWIPWFIDITTDKREQLMMFLKKHNIQTRKTYPEINKTPMYYEETIFKNSKYISENGLFLPSHTLLTDKEIVFVCDLIKVFYSINE